uniref:RBR-type E3 ubiquitin transferase n=1 Tax=Caenorhabditis tropicalis TaxID=1561998 RepID=A0A1I7TGW7_9PELO
MSSDEDDLEYEEMETDKKEYEFLSFDQIRSEINDAITSVQSVIEAPNGVCRILLHKYKWNEDSLLERFYESPDTRAFLVAANVVPKETVSSSGANGQCEICFEEEEMVELACKHRACRSCWNGYLTQKIMDERMCEIKCMMPDCQLIMEDEKIHEFISDPVVLATYEKLTVDSYVQASIFLKWCPGVECGRAVKLEDCDRHIVICPCGMMFCSSCGNDTHEPISCGLLKLWLKRQEDDSETANWINVHTKECPKCHVAIEKNQGCNHMTCRECKHQFCWLCMKPWSGHANCNRYEDAERIAQQSITRSNLERFLFYTGRYNSHRESLEHEKKLKETVEFKIRQLAMSDYGWVDAQYLKRAVEVLADSRKTLMNTFAFAFYLEKDNNSIIFESNQSDLQLATESLSRILGSDLDVDQISALKSTIQDSCRYVDSRRVVLLEHCEEGVNKGFWNYCKRLL